MFKIRYHNGKEFVDLPVPSKNGCVSIIVPATDLRSEMIVSATMDDLSVEAIEETKRLVYKAHLVDLLEDGILEEEDEEVDEEVEDEQEYRVVVTGVVGTVYQGYDRAEANEKFENYKEISLSDKGRAAGESVAMSRDGTIIQIFHGANDFGGP